MGGPRIPDERRIIMPTLAVTVLLFGSVTLFMEKPYIFIFYGCGACTHAVAMYFNRQQIIEHSRGVEGLFVGDSEFRRATLILMGTWFPFPCWMLLSPEGFNIVQNVTIVQLGWAFLNIISKFTLTFYIQRIKDNYMIRVKVKRTMQQQKALPSGGFRGIGPDDDTARAGVANSELHALVLETMTFLGMAQNADRMLQVLNKAKVTNLQELSVLEKADCEEKQLPYDLICAIQSRYRVWALEMVDDAEIGLEKGEQFYNIGLEVYDKPVGAEFSELHGFNGHGQLPRGLNGDDAIPGTVNEGLPYTQLALGSPLQQQVVEVFSEEREDKLVERITTQITTQLTAVMEQVETKLWEKMEYSLSSSGRTFMEHVSTSVDKSVEGVGKHVADCDQTLRFGLLDVSKSLERASALLESKVEFVFSSVKSEHSEAITNSVNSNFQELAVKTLQSTADFENKVMSAIDARFTTIEADVRIASEAVSKLQDLQQSGVARLDGSIADMTEGCAHQIIQESKAAAYTLQAKLTVLEESQNQRAFEHEERLNGKLTMFQNALSEKVTNAISVTASQYPSMRSLPCDNALNDGAITPVDREAAVAAGARTLDALSSLERNVSEMIKGMTNENSKQLELGLGVFGSALRTQLDSMHQSQTGLQRECEQKLESKLDRIQEQGRKHTDKIISQLTLQQASALEGGGRSPMPSKRNSVSGSARHAANTLWNDA
jgi:hypothetical protein